MGRTVGVILALMLPLACAQAHPDPVGVAKAIPVECWLPVSLGSPGPGGGFVSYPPGRFERDPAALKYYDAPAHRWLPSAAVSPDGTHYADLKIAGSAGRIDLVDVRKGTSRTIWRGEWAVTLLGFGPEGVYFARHTPNKTEGAMTTPYLWVVDPASGSAREIYPRRGEPADLAWNYVSSLGPWALPFSLLTDGKVVSFPAAAEASLLGFDAEGGAITRMGSSIDTLTASGQVREVAKTTDRFRPVAAGGDRHGIWFTTPSALWLMPEGGRPRQVGWLPAFVPPRPTPRPAGAPIPAVAEPAIPYVPAGPCAAR